MDACSWISRGCRVHYRSIAALLSLIWFGGCENAVEVQRDIEVKVMVFSTRRASTGVQVGKQYVAFSSTGKSNPVSMWGQVDDLVDIYVSGGDGLSVVIGGEPQEVQYDRGKWYFKGVIK